MGVRDKREEMGWSSRDNESWAPSFPKKAKGQPSRNRPLEAVGKSKNKNFLAEETSRDKFTSMHIYLAPT